MREGDGERPFGFESDVYGDEKAERGEVQEKTAVERERSLSVTAPASKPTVPSPASTPTAVLTPSSLTVGDDAQSRASDDVYANYNARFKRSILLLLHCF